MKRITDFYIAHAKLIGVLYCAVPVFIWFGIVLISVPFREVYALRLALCLLIGCPIGAYLNQYGLDQWMLKHKSASGPGSVCDGMLNGGAIGLGIALLPALTSLISTNHLEEAKTFIIVLYLASAALGGLIGGVVAMTGKKYIAR